MSTPDIRSPLMAVETLAFLTRPKAVRVFDSLTVRLAQPGRVAFYLWNELTQAGWAIVLQSLPPLTLRALACPVRYIRTPNTAGEFDVSAGCQWKKKIIEVICWTEFYIPFSVPCLPYSNTIQWKVMAELKMLNHAKEGKHTFNVLFL